MAGSEPGVLDGGSQRFVGVGGEGREGEGRGVGRGGKGGGEGREGGWGGEGRGGKGGGEGRKGGVEGRGLMSYCMDPSIGPGVAVLEPGVLDGGSNAG